MSRKRKGQFTLLESIDLLEATTAQNYPDNGTGVTTDDDRPPGNIVYGEKYKRTPYFNKLTDFQDSWELDDSDWKWDEFELSGGMEDENNYSDTIKSMKELFPKETWKNIWKRMKPVSKAQATQGFIDAGQPWRKGGKEGQTGYDKDPHVDIDMTKGGKFKDAEIKTNEKITKRIDNLMI